MSSNLDDLTFLNLWYQFEDSTASNSGNNEVDSTTFMNGPNGRGYTTLNDRGVISTSEKKFGSKSLDLTTFDAFLYLPPTNLQNLGYFTVATWFKTNKQTGLAGIFNYGSSASNSLFFQLNCETNQLGLRAPDNVYNNYTKPLNDNEWHHVIATYEKTSTTNSPGQVKYYIDGVLITTTNDVTLSNEIFQYVGNTHWGSGVCIGGYIDDFRFYTKTLTAEEAAALYDRGVSHDIVCFLEGTQIACLDEETAAEIQLNIEDITPGTLIKTYVHGFVPVDCINYKMIENPTNTERVKNRLYKCSPDKYPGLKKDLILTGSHAILEDTLSNKQKIITVEELGKVFVTDEKYRLMAMADERAEPYVTKSKQSKVWHVCLEHEDYEMNYGIYANGLLVESCSKRNMDLGMP